MQITLVMFETLGVVCTEVQYGHQDEIQPAACLSSADMIVHRILLECQIWPAELHAGTGKLLIPGVQPHSDV